MFITPVPSTDLESGKPSDTVKVALRAREMRALLHELSAAFAALAPAPRVAILGGDFNALREEFLLGNIDAFFEREGVAAVRPPLRRPRADAPRSLPPDPPIARLSDSGELELACPSCDGGYLREATLSPGGGGCTHAGDTMVIDFIVIGVADIPDQHLPIDVKPRPIVSEEDVAAAADPANGTRHAVTRFGSDHLPVACTLLARAGSTASGIADKEDLKRKGQ